jgi:hypothetical protein
MSLIVLGNLMNNSRMARKIKTKKKRIVQQTRTTKTARIKKMLISQKMIKRMIKRK